MMAWYFMPFRSKTYAVLSTLCGVIAAILISEIALRQISFQTADRKSEEVRQYQEGISVSHFVRTKDLMDVWRRVTGNPYIADAPSILMLGDSYLAAKQVSDQATMESILERQARKEGWQINVAAYGMPSGAAPPYAAFADRLLKRWNPQWVVVLLTTGDLGRDPLTKCVFYRMKISASGTPEITEIPIVRGFRPLPFERKSALVQAIHFRINILLPAKENEKIMPRDPVIEAQLPMVPTASVTLLKKAYRERLIIVFLPEMTMRTDPEPLPEEKKIETACKLQNVHFFSLRNEFLRLRGQSICVKGFHNTPPGIGHFNKTGHRVVAEVLLNILNYIRAHVQPPADTKTQGNN